MKLNNPFIFAITHSLFQLTSILDLRIGKNQSKSFSLLILKLFLESLLYSLPSSSSLPSLPVNFTFKVNTKISITLYQSNRLYIYSKPYSVFVFSGGFCLSAFSFSYDPLLYPTNDSIIIPKLNKLGTHTVKIIIIDNNNKLEAFKKGSFVVMNLSAKEPYIPIKTTIKIRPLIN